jgi:hypothetical protein
MGGKSKSEECKNSGPNEKEYHYWTVFLPLGMKKAKAPAAPRRLLA